MVASVVRPMTGHRIDDVLESFGEMPLKTEGRDLTDKTLRPAQKPEQIDGETW